MTFALMMRITFLSIVLLFSVSLFSQDLTGTWKGKIYSDVPGDSTVLELKVRFNKKNVLAGSTTQRFGVFNYTTAVISIKYDSVANSVFLRERTVIDKELWDYTSPTLSEYNLKFEGNKKLTGMIYCFMTLDPKVGLRGACPAPMKVELWKQE